MTPTLDGWPTFFALVLLVALVYAAPDATLKWAALAGLAFLSLVTLPVGGTAVVSAYVVLHGRYAQTIDADSPEEAALEAARYLSVYDNIKGLALRVFPLEFAREIRVQYERPNSADGPDERLLDYGRPRIVAEFEMTPYREQGQQVFSPKQASAGRSSGEAAQTTEGKVA